MAKRRLCLGPTSVITALHYLHCPSAWVCFPEHMATITRAGCSRNISSVAVGPTTVDAPVNCQALPQRLLFPQPSGSPICKPRWPSEQEVLGGSSSWCWIPRLRNPMSGSDHSLLRNNICCCSCSHVYGFPTLGCGFWLYCVSSPATKSR